MDEYIDVRFQKNARPLRIKRRVPEGIEFDEPDPIQRTVYIGFDAANDITTYRMRRVRQLQGWDPGQFKLHVAVEDGSLILRGVDPDSLPEGRYTLRVQLAEAKTRQQKRTISVDENGHAEALVDVETDDRDVAVDLTGCDPDVRRVLDASSFDDEDAITWLDDDDRRPTRKACLLNLLASLRVRPSVSEPLIRLVQRFYWINNERAYARVDRVLLTKLEELSLDPRKPFYREGRPKADIHKKLVEAIPVGDRDLFSADRLISFRGEGSPSLQMVIAEPPAGCAFAYADIDLDLGNALQDLVGFIVHMGELAGGTPTNHFDMRKKLTKTSASNFLYYTLV